MKTIQYTAMIVCLSLICVQAHARFARPDLEKIPIERLAENLEKQIDEEPKNIQLRVNLARLYAMGYAMKTDTAEVNKRLRGPKSPWFGFTPAHVPFTAKETDDQDAQKAAEKKLAMAIDQYERVLEIEEKNLTAKLGYAWCLEQSGKLMQAMDAYREAVELGWAAEKDLDRAGIMFQSATAEAAGYLMKHLDEKDDAKEIAELKERIAHIRKIPRPITPIAIALSENITVKEIENREITVAFDADGSGELKNWTWINDNAGWLVYDSAGDGRIHSALQMFGNVSFWCFWDNGYHALSGLDNNADGFLTAGELERLAIWQDRNQNGKSEPGEVESLDAWGINRLECNYRRLDSHPEKIPFNAGGATTREGKFLATFDINLHPKDNEKERSSEVSSLDDK